MKQITIGRRAESLFPYQGWPTVCRDKNGVLYAVCSGHRVGHVCPFGKNYLYKSYDEGETWSEPVIVNDTFLDDRDAGIVASDSGEMILSWFNHPLAFYTDCFKNKNERDPDFYAYSLIDGMLETCNNLPPEKFCHGSFIRRSTDGGVNWSEAEIVPVTAPHGPIYLKSGELFYLGKEFHSGYLDKGEIYACKYLDGEWKAVGKINLPSHLTEHQVHEPSVLELENGELLGALRVHDGINEENFTMYLCRSVDGGKSWSTPQPTGISGSPPHLMLHSSGAIILSYARRADNYSERAVISRDGGKTFGEEIILRTSKTDDIGYPSTVELSDGTLLTAYYHYLDEDNFASILGTKWKISD